MFFLEEHKRTQALWTSPDHPQTTPDPHPTPHPAPPPPFLPFSAKAIFLHRVPSPRFLGVPSISGTERPLATPPGELVNRGVDGKSDIIFAAPCATSLSHSAGLVSALLLPRLRPGIEVLRTPGSRQPWGPSWLGRGNPGVGGRDALFRNAAAAARSPGTLPGPPPPRSRMTESRKTFTKYGPRLETSCSARRRKPRVESGPPRECGSQGSGPQEAAAAGPSPVAKARCPRALSTRKSVAQFPPPPPPQSQPRMSDHAKLWG